MQRPQPTPAAARVLHPPPGWYRDRANSSLARYWDGAAWAPTTRPIGPDTKAAPSAPAPSGDVPATPSAPADLLSGHAPPRHVSSRVPRGKRGSLFTRTPFWVALSLGVLAVLGLVLTQLGKSPTAGAGRSARSTTTSPRSPTTSQAPTTTLPAIPVAPQPTAEEAAKALIANWGAGNRTVALSVATPQAVAALFAAPYQSGLAIDRGCSSGSPPVTCTYGPPGGANPNDPIYSLTVAQAPSGYWYVSAAQVEG